MIRNLIRSWTNEEPIAFPMRVLLHRLPCTHKWLNLTQLLPNRPLTPNSGGTEPGTEPAQSPPELRDLGG
ncbi:MAG: hypothetical protein HC865_04770 [Cyanobacteria bacterium RU_5_0]|nr:hypothetical protein [Cyanobacteria bacterium RU_5_0]